MDSCIDGQMYRWIDVQMVNRWIAIAWIDEQIDRLIYGGIYTYMDLQMDIQMGEQMDRRGIYRWIERWKDEKKDEQNMD